MTMLFAHQVWLYHISTFRPSDQFTYQVYLLQVYKKFTDYRVDKKKPQINRVIQKDSDENKNFSTTNQYNYKNPFAHITESN